MELSLAIPLVALSFLPLLLAVQRLLHEAWVTGITLLLIGTTSFLLVFVGLNVVMGLLGVRRLRKVQSTAVPSRSVPWRWPDSLTGRAVAYTAALLAIGGALACVAALLLIAGIAGIMTPLVTASEHSQVQIFGVTVRTGSQAAAAAVAGVVLVIGALGCTAALGRTQTSLASTFLTADGSDRLVEVTSSRKRMLRGFDAERRRIERDLHDGVQPLLVSVTMKLGLARSAIVPGSPGHADLVAAHTQAKQLMGVMREMVNGIYPRVLVDRGLEPACRDLAAKSVVPTRIQTDAFPRLSPEVESVAYFCVSEILNNVNKHSQATDAVMTLGVIDTLPVIDVHDNGRGGAVQGAGTGLTGVADRLATVGGQLSISSPPGGPTLVRMSLPEPGELR